MSTDYSIEELQNLSSMKTQSVGGSLVDHTCDTSRNKSGQNSYSNSSERSSNSTSGRASNQNCCEDSHSNKEANSQVKVQKIKISKLRPNPYNPRLYYDKTYILELALSIQKHGLLNPITVRSRGEFYEIAHGHARVEAVRLLGWEEIDCIVKELADEEMMDIALAENLQRKDLTKVELSLALKKYVERGLTQKEIAEKIGKTQGYVSQILRLSTLPESIQKAVINRLISDTHALKLLELRDWYKTQVEKGYEELANDVAEYFCELAEYHKWSVRELEDEIASFKLEVVNARYWAHAYLYKHFSLTERVKHAIHYWDSYLSLDAKKCPSFEELREVGLVDMVLVSMAKDCEREARGHKWIKDEKGEEYCEYCGFSRKRLIELTTARLPHWSRWDHPVMFGLFLSKKAKEAEKARH